MGHRYRWLGLDRCSGQCRRSARDSHRRNPEVGFEGTDIKAVLVTHEHADHYGGALWLQETFDTPVYMPEIAWDGLATNPGIIEPPTRNLTLEDGVGVTVGNATFTPIATPGHTAGTVSLFFPVYENGVKHGSFSSFLLIQAVRSH